MNPHRSRGLPPLARLQRLLTAQSQAHQLLQLLLLLRLGLLLRRRCWPRRRPLTLRIQLSPLVLRQPRQRLVGAQKALPPHRSL